MLKKWQKENYLVRVVREKNNMDEEEKKRLKTIKNVLLIKTAVYTFIIVFIITIIVRLAG